MDFFKSIFSDTSTTPPSTTPPHTPKGHHSASTPPSQTPTFFQMLAASNSRLPSLLDNYYTDLQEFTSALKNDTSVLRQAASRALHDLPARLESGAALAQESLEAVGEAIDNVGSTFSGIIRSNKTRNNNYSSDDDHDHDVSSRISKRVVVAKPYSRLEAMIRGLQCDAKTYCNGIEEGDYAEWELGFRIGDRKEEIGKLMNDSNNPVMKEIFDELVPEVVDEGTFWCRYFYRVDRVIKAEEARLRIVKKAFMEDDEEELSWDVDDEGENEEAGVSGTKEGSEGKGESDFSIISSRRSSRVSEDFSWDEMEDIREGGSRRQSAELGRDEKLAWDVEDED